MGSLYLKADTTDLMQQEVARSLAPRLILEIDSSESPVHSAQEESAYEVRLLLGLLAYTLGNLLRRPVLPVSIQSWSLTSLQQRLFKDRRAPHPACSALRAPAAEDNLTGSLFRRILHRIERLAWHPI